MSTIRPRGESASAPHSTYVGQVSRQNPQCTQSSMSVLLGRPVGVERGHQIPPTNRPGLQVPAGSKRRLTRRISSSAGPETAPQRSRLGARRRVEHDGHGARGEPLAQPADRLGVELQIARARAPRARRRWPRHASAARSTSAERARRRRDPDQRLFG